jgi:hypothetical protein
MIGIPLRWAGFVVDYASRTRMTAHYEPIDVMLMLQPVRQTDIITVHPHDIGAIAICEAGIHGGGQTTVLRQTHKRQFRPARIGRKRGKNSFLIVINGAINDQYNPFGNNRLAVEAFQRGSQIIGSFRCIGRHQDTHTGGRPDQTRCEHVACSGRWQDRIHYRAPFFERTTPGVRSKMTMSFHRLKFRT